MLRVLAILVFIVAPNASAVGGDIRLLGELGELQQVSPYPVIGTWDDSLITCLYVLRYPPKDSSREARAYRRRQLQYAEFQIDGDRVATYELNLRTPEYEWPMNDPAFAMKNKDGYTFVGLSHTHMGLRLIILDPDCREILNEMSEHISPGLMLTSFASDGDLVICGWRFGTPFLRVGPSGEQTAFGSRRLMNRYSHLCDASRLLSDPRLMSVINDQALVLGSYRKDFSQGYSNVIDEFNQIGLCIYDSELDTITLYREFDLLSDPAVQLTDLPPMWKAFTDHSSKLTTIYGSYRDETDSARMFILTVDEKLNPVESPKRRIERFEDEVEIDKTRPYQHIYYFERGPHLSLWLHHIILTPEVLYHAEYETLKY